MASPRKIARVNHLSLANAMKQMLKGRFTAPSVMETSGLGRTTVYELLRTFSGQGLITVVGKEADCTGRKRVEVYEVAREAIGNLYFFSGARA